MFVVYSLRHDSDVEKGRISAWDKIRAYDGKQE